jgi:phosphohistidine phosphatase SixA
LLLLRHASARRQDEWGGEDRDRPLDERGARQAEALVDLLGDYPIARIVSSDAARCLATVAPLARSRGLEIEVRPELGAEGQATVGAALVRSLAADDVLACGHAGLEVAALSAPPRWKKGAVLVVDDALTVRRVLRP